MTFIRKKNYEHRIEQICTVSCQDDSVCADERKFEYLVCAVCPVSGDYEAGRPECGFLFPSYAEGGALMNCIDIYQADISRPHRELENLLL